MINLTFAGLVCLNMSMFATAECLVGHYGTDGKACQPCSTNQYQNKTGQTSCTHCPVDTVNKKTGSTDIADCLRERFFVL